MKTRHALITALTAGAALALAGCGGSYDDSRDLYEEMRVEIGCDTVDSDDFDSFMEGEVAGGVPAFDAVEGECSSGDESFEVLAVVPHDVKGKDFLESMQADAEDMLAVDGGKWVVLVEGDDEEDQAFTESVQDALGGTAVAFTEGSIEKL